NGDDLRKGRVKPDRWPKVVKATEKLARSPLYVDDSSDIGILEVRAKARRLHARRELGLLVADYLQLMRPEDSSQSRVEQIGQISRGLKILARELNIPGIPVAQLSRAVESRRINRTTSRRIGTGIPKRYRGVSFERNPVSEMDPYVVQQVRQFVRRIERNVDEGNGLWFYGDVGTGKTSLAMIVSKAALEAGR